MKVFDAAGGGKDILWTAYEQAASIRRGIGNSGSRVDFDYGPNCERLRRLDFPTAGATDHQTETHYVGSAEIRYDGNSNISEVRRYLGGMLIVQDFSGTNQRIRREYFLIDAQGSTYAVLDDFGMPINASARMAFDPWGLRRKADNWSVLLGWSPTLRDELLATTRKGYTGHEQLDGVGIIHMGGRIYDPALGRFLQADPFIQSPGNSQSYNRYSYVFNNPMAYTDPTGYWGRKEQAGLRTVVAIAIMCFTGVYAYGAETWAGTMAWSAAGGFAAGAVQTGTLRGATTGAISSMAFAGVARAMPLKGADITTKAGMARYAQVALVSGFVGGVMAEVQGGRFGNGFATAGANVMLSPVPEAMTGNPGGQIVITAVIGGTISEATGGNFGNGAITAAFQFAVAKNIPSHSTSELPVGTGGIGFRAGEYYVPNSAASNVDITIDGGYDSALVARIVSGVGDYFASVGINLQFNVVSSSSESLQVTFFSGTPLLNPREMLSLAVQTKYPGRTFASGIFVNVSHSSPVYAFAHEFAHASGLVDRYSGRGDNQSPDVGYEGNLMGITRGRNMTANQIVTMNTNLSGGWQRLMRATDGNF